MLIPGRVRRRIALVSFALLAPVLLGGCNSNFCEEPSEDSLGALVRGFLCVGFPSRGEAPTASFVVRPGTIASGESVTLDPIDSEPGRNGQFASFRWDVDGVYTLNGTGQRQFDFELSDAFIWTPVTVPLFRRSPDSVEPRGELIDDGTQETRVIGLRVANVAGGVSIAQRRVRITGDPAPPGGPPPVARFTISPERPTAGQAVTFDGSTSTGAESWAWDLDGEGGFESGPLPSLLIFHVFNSPGLHVVRLQVTDEAGRTAVQPKEIFVAPPGAATARAATSMSARLARVRFPEELGQAQRTRRGTFAFPPLTARGRLIAVARGSLRPFRRSRWRARLAISADPRSRGIRVKGLALARFPNGAGRACLRVRVRASRGGSPRGRITVLGGTGAAGELAGGGRIGFRFRGRTPRVTGNLGLRLGRPRPLPAACARL